MTPNREREHPPTASTLPPRRIIFNRRGSDDAAMAPNRKRDPTHVVAVKYKTTKVPKGVVEPGDAYVTVAQWQWHSLLNYKY